MNKPAINKLALTAAGLACAFAMQSVAAEGMTFRPRVGTGWATYELDIDSNDEAVKADYVPFTVGGTLMGETFFVDAGYLTGSGDTDIDGLKLDRTEVTAMFGARFGSGGSAYVGYLDAESDFKSSKFSSSGFIAGAGFTFGDIFAGSLTASVGLAYLEGKYSDDVSKADADYTIGYSAGLGYVYPVTESFSVKLDGKFSWYSYDFTEFADTTVDETFGSVILTAAYAF